MADSETKPAGLDSSAGLRISVNTSVWLALVVVAYALYVAQLGRALDAAGIGLALRLQGRLSFLFYLLGVAAPGLHALSGSRVNAWLARQRDALLRAYALSHSIHGIWVVLYFVRTDAVFAWNVFDGSGVVAFALNALFLLPRSVRQGARWARLELGVIAYIWIQFVGFFINRLGAGRPELRGWYVVAIVLSCTAAGLAWSTRSRTRSAQPGRS